MMTKLKKYELNNELAYQYYRECLEGTNELSNEIVSSIDFKSGTFFTFLNDNIDHKNLYEFSYGGVAKNGRNKVRDLILAAVRNNEPITAIFDAYNHEYIKEYDEPLFMQFGMYYENEVYYTLVKETVSPEIVDECLYFSNTFWHSLCVLSEVHLNLNEKKLSREQIKDICLKTKLVIVGAYDAESYVFWERGKSVG